MAMEGDSIFWVDIHKVSPNPLQPRRDFDEARLKDLSESIRMYGILQPLTVTRVEKSREDGGLTTEYELIAGERRLRASKLAGLERVPVIIRTGEDTDRMKLELAIIENLQREDLNPVERALAFKQLAEQFKLSAAEVGRKVGRSRMFVSNTMRLLNLPEEIIASLRKGEISEAHARTLLMLSDRPAEQKTLFRETILKKLSVREVERIARKIAIEKVRKRANEIDLELVALEKQFTESLGTRVQISKTDFGGKLTIDYFSPDDLHKILDVVSTSREKMKDAFAPMRDPSSVLAEYAAEKAAVDRLRSSSPEEAAQNVANALEEEGISTPLPPAPPNAEPEVVAPPTDDTSASEREKATEEDADLYAVKNFSL